MAARTRPTARLTACLTSAAALALLASAALAHDTWLLPLRPVAPPGVEVAFDLTSGMAFPANETALAPDRVARGLVRLGGVEEALPAPVPTPRSLRFRVPLRRAGVATVHVDLAPRALTLTAAQVTEYLDEIGAPDSVRQAYRAQPAAPDGTRRWRERYAKHATAYVRVTSPLRPVPASDSSWRVPTGAALELVPERDPTTLRPGDTLRVRLVRAASNVAVAPGGLPLPFTTVGVVGPGLPAVGMPRRTDAVGRVAFVVPRAGRYLLRATVLRRATAADLDWESDFATLTVAVR